MRHYSIEELERDYDTTKNRCLLTRNALYLRGPIIEIDNGNIFTV